MDRNVTEILIAEDSAEDAELAIGALDEFKPDESCRADSRRGGSARLSLLTRELRRSHQPQSSFVAARPENVERERARSTSKDEREAPELVDIPVTVLSSPCEQLDLKETQQFGPNAYVVGPGRFQEFMAAVKTIGRFWAVLNILKARWRCAPDAYVGQRSTNPESK